MIRYGSKNIYQKDVCLEWLNYVLKTCEHSRLNSQHSCKDLYDQFNKHENLFTFTINKTLIWGPKITRTTATASFWNRLLTILYSPLHVYHLVQEVEFSLVGEKWPLKTRRLPP